MSTPSNVIIQGNCLDILPQIEAGTVDFILTDPPYIARYKVETMTGQTRFRTMTMPRGLRRHSPKCTAS